MDNLTEALKEAMAELLRDNLEVEVEQFTDYDYDTESKRIEVTISFDGETITTTDTYL